MRTAMIITEIFGIVLGMAAWFFGPKELGLWPMISAIWATNALIQTLMTIP